MARNESPDRRPLLYGFAAVLILLAAGFIFWPRGDRTREPGMVLTPDAGQGQLAGQIETPSEEPGSTETTLAGGTGDELSPESVQAQPIAETEYAVEGTVNSQSPTQTDRNGVGTSGSTTTNPTTPSRTTTQSAPRATNLDQPGPSGRYLLYLGSFSTRENAQNRATELQGKGVPAEIMSGTKADGSVYYRVRVGYFEGHSRAKSYGESLKQRLGLDYWIAER
jgi:cell division septation protein DedD